MLTPEQMVELQTDLATLALELEALLVQTKASTAPVELDQPIGRLSRMDAMQQQKMSQANRQRNETRLKMVRAALAAFPEDEYGYCKRCDEPVGFKRLKIRPEAPFCVTCQDQFESRK
jgi:DnaK suppressor protein